MIEVVVDGIERIHVSPPPSSSLYPRDDFLFFNETCDRQLSSCTFVYRVSYLASSSLSQKVVVAKRIETKRNETKQKPENGNE